MFFGVGVSMSDCPWTAGPITSALIFSPVLPGGDSGDRASCIGSGAGISLQDHPLPSTHPHPRNLLLESGLSPHLWDGDTPKGSLPSTQTCQGVCTLASVMGSVPWPLVELFL